MSRISPFHFNVNEYDDEELENICPRYLKWMKKVKAFDFSKRKKGKIDRSAPSFDSKYKLAENSRKPKRPKSFISKIRKGGQNLRVRVRTSADLWRRWIRGGIMYNTELNEKDEIEQEEQQSGAQIIIKVEPQPTLVPMLPEEKEPEDNKTAEVITETTEKEKTEEENKTETNNIKPMSNKCNETTNIDENHIQTHETKTEKQNIETKETQSIETPDLNSQEIPESKAKENVIKSNTNSNISINNSSTGMPEVVADND